MFVKSLYKIITLVYHVKIDIVLHINKIIYNDNFYIILFYIYEVNLIFILVQ